MANKRMQLLGIEKVMRNLNKEIGGIKSRSMRGLIRAAILIRRDMEATPPLIPVDTGNLRASWFVTTGRGDVSNQAHSFKGSDGGKTQGEYNRALASATAKASAVRSTGRPILIMGFGASYGPRVHEMERFNSKRQAKLKRRSGAGPKFFEASLERNQTKIIGIIREESAKRR